MTATETRQGIGVSPGSAYGPVVQVAPPVRPPADEPAVDDREAALADVRAAFESVAVALEGKARHADDTAQQILKATALIARDKGLVKAADKQLAAGPGPGHRHRERGRGVLRPVRGARRLLRRAGHRPA